MALLLAGLLALTILVIVCRAVASDGYGTRPAPRSHHDVDAVDNHGMPTKYLR
jgi:hypothetical protein